MMHLINSLHLLQLYPVILSVFGPLSQWPIDGVTEQQKNIFYENLTMKRAIQMYSIAI